MTETTGTGSKASWIDLWNMLEEVQAQVELPEDLDAKVTNLLWDERNEDAE